MPRDPAFHDLNPRRAAVSRVSEDAWTQARSEYLAGESGPTVCERHGIGLTTFRERARHDGWRRTDMKDSLMTSSREVLPASADYAELAAEAGMRMREALARGRAADVVSWMRVQDQLADRLGRDYTALQDAARGSRDGIGALQLLHDDLADLIGAAASDGDPDLAEALENLAAMSASLEEIKTGRPNAGLRSS